MFYETVGIKEVQEKNREIERGKKKEIGCVIMNVDVGMVIVLTVNRKG